MGKLVGAVKNPAGALSAVGDKIKAGADMASSAISFAKEKFFGGLKSFADDAIRVIDTLTPALDALLEASQKMDTAFMGFADVLRKTSDIFAGRGAGSVNVDVMTDRLANAAASIVEMTNTLAQVDTVELQTKVEQILGTDLFTAEAKEAGKVQINVTVNMDAKKFANAMVKTKILPGT